MKMKFWPYVLAAAIVASVTSAVSTMAVAQPHGGKSADRHSSVKKLPKTHYRVMHSGKPYYFSGGRFYRQSSGLYVSITAPIGAVIPALPGGFITIGTGPSRYYYYAGIYYRSAPKGYVVVEAPSNPPAVLPAEEESGRIIVYPATGQSEEQTGRDRYECHLWASKETDYDPTLSSSDANLKDDYNRAMSACLEARDYVVK